MIHNSIKIAVGMSGGVDSSVAAFLLKEQGYDVVGFFMKLWHEPLKNQISNITRLQMPEHSDGGQENQNDNAKCKIITNRENACCDEKALADARAVAKKLGIPFYVVDAREQFKKDVTDYFIEEYKNCRTPNPCVVCNEKIKFGWLLEYAEKLGCDFLATGHYARIAQSTMDGECPNGEFTNNTSSPNIQQNVVIPAKAGIQPAPRSSKSEVGENQTGSQIKSGMTMHLFKGKDSTRDQSYFLYRLNQEQLSKILFPVGDMEKREVREIAKKNDLPVFQKAESREICFVADDYRKFLERNLPADSFAPGDIVDTKGNVIGKHEGLSRYTVGQRRGIIKMSNTQYSTSIQQSTPNIQQNSVIPAEAGIQKNATGSQIKSGMTVSEDTKPLYVIKLDKEKNQLVVGENAELWRSEFLVGETTFINPETELRIMNNELRGLAVKIRYQAETVPCSIRSDHDSLFIIHTSVPVRALTPGQSAVIYDGDEVVGGGVIASQ